MDLPTMSRAQFNGAPIPPSARDAADRHRAVVESYNRGELSPLRPEEVAILNLARGILGWITGTKDAGDGYFGPEVTAPMCEAFRSALGGPTGRLSCGVLDEWALYLAGSVGIGLNGEEAYR